MLNFSVVDLAALVLSFGLWQTFGIIVDHTDLSKNSLTAAVNAERLEWMRRLTNRDNRIVDSTLIANLMHSVSFFASATVLILGGVAAMAGTADHAYNTIQGIPFVTPVSKDLFEGKLLLLGLVFIYSFLKFTWSLRQFNYCSILAGSAPAATDPEEEKEAFAVRAARVNELGARSFNQGLRGYYFALATLAWFLHPLAFVAATVAVVAILWRREFHSRTRRALRREAR
ncbi:DUF599 domain-containing protein [Telmatospirillum sp.]|uniref:DUF599 domain-containing protein n=1 Tax=Telmatospirillum sp. TaxID=2079197 RepID=UPI00284D0FD5|nr:DUF599 domain-containing protein [Telmatospirillum sp.]MDR3439000.1 DUF599 domain-containing protein [Telmatospirillum sp.]